MDQRGGKMTEKYEIDKETAIKLNKELAQKQDIKQKLEKDKEKNNLQNVYDVFKKWLGIREIDTNRIDIVLATAISNKLEGTPIWLFLVGASGDWKTTLVESLDDLPNVELIDQLTKNTLASGKQNAEDLGETLQNNSTIMIILDLASLTSTNREEKNQIWGQFRTLYDGDIYKRTGSGVNKAYTGCHVTIIACTTESIRDEILIHAQLGTRELMYDTGADPVDNNFKMDKAWENENYEKQMKKEMRDAVRNFVNWHPVKKDIEIPEDIKDFLKKEANRLSVLRAGGAVDRTYRELINPITPEVPSRLIKQLKRIYICLKSLDDNYSDKKTKQIISHIINSSGEKVRQMILDILIQNPEEEFKIADIQDKLKIGRNSVKTQLEQLWNLGVVHKKTIEERIGGYFTHDYESGREIRKGGRIEIVSYYSYNSMNKLYVVTPNVNNNTTIQHSIYNRGVNDG